MAIEAELADGRILEFPDGTDPSVVQATVRRVLAQAAPPTTAFGQTKEFFKGIPAGAVNLLESAATGASALLPEDMEKSAREKIKSVATAAKAPFTAAPGYEEAGGRKFGEAVGSTGPFFVAGPLGVAGRVAAGALGVGAGAGEARVRAEEGKAEAGDRGTATALGSVVGATEMLPVFSFIKNLGKPLADGISSQIRRAFATGGAEAAQEAAAQAAQNLIAKGLYKPEQAIIEGTGEAAAYGGATGALIQGLTDMALGRRAKGAAPAAQPPVQEPPAQEPIPTAPTPLAERPYPELAKEVARISALADTREATPEEMVQLKALRAELQRRGVAEVEGQRAAATADKEGAEKFPALAAKAPEQMGMRDALPEGPLPPETDLFGNPVQPPAAPTDTAPATPKELEAAGQQRLPLRRTPEGQPTTTPPAPPVPPAAAPTPAPTPAPPAPPAPPAAAAPTAPPTPPAPAKPGAITATNIRQFGIMSKANRQWLVDNVEGKTPDEVRDMVEADPTILTRVPGAVKAIKEIIAQAKPKETPSAQAPAAVPAVPPVQPRLQPRGSEPSVGVPVQPAGADTVAPGATGAPAGVAPPVSSGLVPPKQPAAPGVAPAGQPAPALTADTAATALQTLIDTAGTALARKRAATTALAALQDPKLNETAEDKAGNLRLAASILGQKVAPAAPVAAKPAKAAPAPTAPAGGMFGQLIKPGATIVEDEAPPPAAPAKPASPFDVSGPSILGAQVAPTSEETTAAAAVAQKPAKPAQAAKPAKPVEAVKPEPAKPVVDWTKPHLSGAYSVVYSDEEVALIRGLNNLNQAAYFPMTRDGTIGLRTVSATKPGGSLGLTGVQLDRVQAEAKKAEAEEAARAKQNPDGPFTGALKNVVGSKSVDARYVRYLTDLMQSLGLGDIKVFLYHDTDTRTSDAHDKYRLYGNYTRVQKSRERTAQGAVVPFDTQRQKYGMFVKPGSSEASTLETISHELGHIIEHRLTSLADAPTQKALRTEYEAWLATAKTLNTKEFLHSLRNREDVNNQATTLEGPVGQKPAKDIQNFESYWASYSEWFADNVSRWATTNEKPLTVTEKFFSKVAQMMRDLVAIVTGRKYPPNKVVADFLNKMGPADLTPSAPSTTVQDDTEYFSLSATTESLIAGSGAVDPVEVGALKRMINIAKADPGVSYATKFRTQVADIAATIESRLTAKFDGAVKDALGNLNPMGLYRQAQDYTKMLLEFFQQGSLIKNPTTGLWEVTTGKDANGNPIRPPAEVYKLIGDWGKANGWTREEATQKASRILEAVRLDGLRTANNTQGATFTLHKIDESSSLSIDQQINALLADYRADPALKEMNKLMDESRNALVDHLVTVGRLTPDQGKDWKDVIGYVPFDRLSPESLEKFSKIKRVSGKGLAQVGKLPELKGTTRLAVGNVFNSYIDTMGWMVGQVIKTDGTVQTLRSLEKVTAAKFLGPSSQNEPNVVGMYVDGVMNYWSLPSKYDVMAFKDLNPPKMNFLLQLGAFSNVLRKTITALPPFALKQVTDDVQRAILTSGVKNPGALLRMTLTNFPKLALAEIRGIQHPTVREFGALGLTGEYDFQSGKPAVSLLQDMGIAKRSRFDTLLHRLDGITRASDLAVRKAIYDQTLIEVGDKLLAQTRAREFINFRRRGASETIGVFVTTIPFFNAYIQGMDVLYRAASGKDSSSSVGRAQARQMFWGRAAIVTMLSSLYALGKDDEDEDYKKMDLRTRDSNWILPGGYKLPVPGELGAIFKVIPERVVEYMRRQGTPEEQEAFEAVRTTLTYMFEQYVGRAVPVPQAIKPVLEAWANKSFLTGRPLEGFHQRMMDRSMRVTDQTSELAKAIATFSRDEIKVEVSPIMVDNALRGYFGSTASLLTAMTDSLLNPTRVDRPLHKWALLSNYLYDPVGTRLMTEFYEEREKMGKANSTLNQLMKTDMDRAVQYAETHQDELVFESAINSTLEQLERTRAYRTFLNSPDGAKEMPTKDREAELKEIRKYETDMVQWLREAKTEYAKSKP